MGRKKMEIKRIEKEEARQVCFSKRRRGLFNKASELSILCGAKVAAVVFSPGVKAFTFGNPSVESVLDHFCTSNSSEAQDEEAVDGAAGDRNLALEELNRELGELRTKLAATKARNEAVDEYFAKARDEGCKVAAWLQPDTDVSQMAEEDQAAFLAALEKVRANVAARANQVLQEALLFGRPVHGGHRGKLELGGTSANGGMEMTQQQQTMMMPPAMGITAGTEMTQQQQMMVMPPPMGFAARREMMHQQQMMMMMPPPTGFAAGTEMMQQQQQQQMMMAMPAGFATGMEMMEQQQIMLPPPPLPGFAPGMEMLHQGFGHMTSSPSEDKMRSSPKPILPTIIDSSDALHALMDIRDMDVCLRTRKEIEL